MDSEGFVGSGAHSRGFAAWFLTWNTKYRYKMLAKQAHFVACEAILDRVCRRHGFQLLAVSAMPCTVQLVVVGPHSLSASEYAFLLKGASAHELCEFEPRFHLRYPQGHFWARGFDAKPVSPLDVQKAVDYVKAPHNDPRQTQLN
jgi:REP element-mobilizing transposase RayT